MTTGHKRPRIRSLLLLINLVVLILPVGSIVLLRLYESTLVRNTESSLIAQSVFISSIYKKTITEHSASRSLLTESYGHRVEPSSKHTKWRKSTNHSKWQPRYATLDLSSSPILPRLTDPLQKENKANAIELESGARVSDILRSTQLQTLSGMRVVNPKGVIVASTSDDIGKSIIHWTEIKQSLMGQAVSSLHRRLSDNPSPSYSSISRGSDIRVFVATPVIHNHQVIGAVIVSRTPATLAQFIYNNSVVITLVTIALVLIVILISVVTSFLIANPVKAVSNQATLVADGKAEDLTVLRSPRTAEVHELSSAVVKMGKTLQQRAEYIQNFASQVSHAFKTPLTAMKGALELLKDHYDSMTPAERERFLNNLEDDSNYLEQLVSRLLDYARADTATQLGGSTQLVPFITDLVARAGNKNISINLDNRAGNPVLAIEATVLESVLQNLIDNAVQHGSPPITITVDEAADAHIRISLQDRGAGITAENAELIFTPFFTTAREKGGTGLGLATVKTLLENYGGTIHYEQNPDGARFVLSLTRTPE